MKTAELISVLKTAAESETNLAKKMLFVISAERLKTFSDLSKEICDELDEVQKLLEKKKK